MATSRTTATSAATAWSFTPIAARNPHAYEVKKVYQSVKVEPIDLAAGKIRVHNKYFFTNLDQFTASWILRRDGQRLPAATRPTGRCAPHSQELTIPLPEIDTSTGRVLAHGLLRAARGHPLGREGTPCRLGPDDRARRTVRGRQHQGTAAT